MIHEESAKKVHPEASEFRPVKRLGRVIGWVFELPREGKISVDWGWVTSTGETSTDKLGRVMDAERNLKAYLRMKRQAPVNALEKRA